MTHEPFILALLIMCCWISLIFCLGSASSIYQRYRRITFIIHFQFLVIFLMLVNIILLTLKLLEYWDF